jgi:hypothetical protein
MKLASRRIALGNGMTLGSTSGKERGIWPQRWTVGKRGTASRSRARSLRAGPTALAGMRFGSGL